MNSRGQAFNLFSRKKSGQKGQAFSTFQLLIAAVVALAILVLLLNIIGSLPNLGGQKPNKVASDLVASQVNAPSELRTSNPVIFVKGDSLNAEAIASASGVVTEGQLCLSEGDHYGSGDFAPAGDNDKILRYTGSTNLRVRISVLCDTGEEIPDDLSANEDGADAWAGGCGLPGSQTGCIIALRYT
jgi:hypothetical protein